jgi:hypothetical protein
LCLRQTKFSGNAKDDQIDISNPHIFLSYHNAGKIAFDKVGSQAIQKGPHLNVPGNIFIFYLMA